MLIDFSACLSPNRFDLFLYEAFKTMKMSLTIQQTFCPDLIYILFKHIVSLIYSVWVMQMNIFI